MHINLRILNEPPLNEKNDGDYVDGWFMLIIPVVFDKLNLNGVGIVIYSIIII